MGIPVVHKDLFLISLVSRLSGAESAIPLEEFLENIKSAAQLGDWVSLDCLRVAVLKLAEPARSFYNTCWELHAEDATWDKFKKVFRERFRDVRTDQFHSTRLQTAKQGKKEGPQEFADRCRALAPKVMRPDDNPAVQKIHMENAEGMLLASFVAGLSGKIGKLTRVQNPRNLDQGLNTAHTIRKALRQEKNAETFFTKSEKSVEVSNRGKDRHVIGRAEPKCYECKGRGHCSRMPHTFKKGANTELAWEEKPKRTFKPSTLARRRVPLHERKGKQ
jgi:hypothetical protein